MVAGTIAETRRQRSRQSRDTGTTYFIRKMLKHPTWDKDRLQESTINQGYSMGDRYCSISWSIILNVFQVLLERGGITEEELLQYVKPVSPPTAARPSSGRKTSRSGASGKKRTKFATKRTKSKAARQKRTAKR